MRRLTALVFALVVLSVLGCRSDDDKKNNGGSDGPVTNSDGGGPGEGGVTPSGATIFDITSGKIKEGEAVVLGDVVISAVDGYGKYTGDLFIQDPKGGAGSGLKLFMPQRIDGGELVDLKPGDHVKVEGTVKYFTPSTPFDDTKHPNKVHVKELEKPNLTHLSSGEPPAPAVVTVKELTEDPTAEGWEAVLVQVKDVAVTSAVNPQYGEFEVTGNLAVDDDLFPAEPKVGDCLSVTGISVYFYEYRLNPRSDADLAPGTGCPEPTTVTIKDLQDTASAKHPADGDPVTVSGVITAVDGAKSGAAGAEKYDAFWIQDGTGPLSGIAVHYIWDDTTALKPVLGDTVEVTGTYKEYYDESQLDKVTFVIKGKGAVPAAEVFANPADIATGGSQAEPFEGVLVEVNDVEVKAEVKTTPKTGEPRVVGIELTSGLYVESDLFNGFINPPPAAGAKYKTLRGVLRYSFSNFKILPRSADDLVQ